MEKYVPPFDITNKMLELSSLIMEQVGKLSHVNDLERLPRLQIYIQKNKCPFLCKNGQKTD